MLISEKSEPGDQVYVEGVAPAEKTISFKEFQTLSITVQDNKVVCDGKVLKTDKEELTSNLPNNSKVR
ncbi:MAG: hypothetical protein ABIH34_02895 [Nanoarchaeota archaeon]